MVTTHRRPPGAPASAQQRVQALARYSIWESDVEPAFDRVCQAAARILRAPAAAVVFSDGDRHWVKSRCGFQAVDGTGESMLFRDTLAQDQVLLVEDAGNDPRFRDDAWVCGVPHVRFYAGAPLRTPDGVNIGVLAVFGAQARSRAELDCDSLLTLAAVLMDEAELRAGGGHAARAADSAAEPAQVTTAVAQAERLASLGTLAAGVAHEINNPLTYVLANVGFVADRLLRLGRSLPQGVTLEWADELGELGAALAEAQEGALRVRRIVRDLKVFSDNDDEILAPVDLHGALESAIKVATHEIGARAKVVRQFGAVPLIDASETRLAQLFVNLLVNAAQAIGPGGADANEVRVITETNGAGCAMVRVQDTGSGIAGESIGRVFDPFFTTRPLGGGLGLGLFVAHGIVKALGGSISVDSEPGRGTTFCVVLPASEARAEPLASDRRPTVRLTVDASTPAPKPRPRTMTPAK